MKTPNEKAKRDSCFWNIVMARLDNWGIKAPLTPYTYAEKANDIKQAFGTIFDPPATKVTIDHSPGSDRIEVVAFREEKPIASLSIGFDYP